AVAAEDISAEMEATATLYDIYKATNNHNKALENYERFIVLKDSLFKEDNQREIAQKELEYEYEKKAAADSVRNEEEKRVKDALIFAKNAQIEQDKTQKWALAGGVILLIIFGFFMYNRFKITQKQKNIIEEKQKEISASINYAKRIQYALLAHDELLKTNLPDHFVLFKPKDIVSGDFYWATQKEDKFYLAVCDSTGHGVPGAFMSLLNISFLNEAINEKNMEEPNRILEHVRKRLIKNISQEGAQDGMDGILICFDRKNNSISYAAAHNKPILMKGTELIELPADKMPIGKGEKNEPFRLHTISAQKGDMLYLFTDGYADQFGGEHGKKFKYKQLEELFRKISSESLNNQREKLETTFINWQGNLEQIDDVCIIGIRF
ncbi:MAG: SpoIIE family protein phosphatase, partial [Bacteroidia bacterium]|nr:SpoIIE family protein phosphatase [Bacteroidia bacterium]